MCEEVLAITRHPPSRKNIEFFLGIAVRSLKISTTSAITRFLLSRVLLLCLSAKAGMLMNFGGSAAAVLKSMFEEVDMSYC